MKCQYPNCEKRAIKRVTQPITLGLVFHVLCGEHAKKVTAPGFTVRV